LYNIVKRYSIIYFALTYRNGRSGEGEQNQAEWYGRKLIKIDRWFPSSKRCGNCGHTVSKLPLKIREWDCPECGTHHDRDINAANNILAQGLGLMSVERV